MEVFHSLGDVKLAPRTQGTCVALGMFDGLHLGHQRVICEAVAQATVAEDLSPCIFTFSINHNDRPAAKPVAQLLSESLREQLLTAWGVEYMLHPGFEEFRALSPLEFVRDILAHTLKARYLFCGENYHFGKKAAGTPADLQELGRQFGMETTVLPLMDQEGAQISSTRIRECVASGDVKAAALLLGRPFAIDFAVISGRQLGRTLGAPTINQPIPASFIVPRLGVYATIATVDGKRYPAVTNVGYKPTVGSDQLLAETYLHGFAGDLYGRNVLVEFLQFIRAETKFASVELLQAQIGRDNLVAAKMTQRYL